MDTVIVSLVVIVGIVALGGVPMRLWQIATGRFRDKIPPHPVARATFSLFSLVFCVPSALAWTYALFVVYRDFSCPGSCPQAGVTSAIAVGLLGCAYLLLEGFLLTARRRVTTVTRDS